MAVNFKRTYCVIGPLWLSGSFDIKINTPRDFL